VADFNLDGKMDFVVGNYTVTGNFESEPQKFFKTVSVMLNQTNFQQLRPAAFRVNCGGSTMTTPRGITFSADGNFDGGEVITTDATIEGTENPQLYQSARQGNFTYTARVAAGRPYTVKILFAEISAKKGKKRSFSISLNGNTIIKNFNVLKRAPLNRAYKIVRHHVWADQNGQIRLEFSGKKGGAICSGISIF
jgi:kinesin family protein C2/C3